MKMYCLALLSCLTLIVSSCTYSITMVHTEGTASDVVDETQTSQPNVKADLNIPASVL